jgi:hypothetical protein
LAKDRAAFLAAGFILSWLLARTIPTDPLALARPGANLEVGLIVPLCMLLGLWLWSAIDAWQVAGRSVSVSAR